MTPRERIIKALEGKPTDILPYVDGFQSMEARREFLRTLGGARALGGSGPSGGSPL